MYHTFFNHNKIMEEEEEDVVFLVDFWSIFFLFFCVWVHRVKSFDDRSFGCVPLLLPSSSSSRTFFLSFFFVGRLLVCTQK